MSLLFSIGSCDGTKPPEPPPVPCGEKPEFSIEPAVWLSSNYQSTPEEASRLCKDLYEPLTILKSKKTNIELPSGGYAGASVDLGEVDLNKEYQSAYDSLGEGLKVLENSAKTVCFRALTVYQCTMYPNTDDDPMINEANRLKTIGQQIAILEQVSELLDKGLSTTDLPSLVNQLNKVRDLQIDSNEDWEPLMQIADHKGVQEK